MKRTYFVSSAAILRAVLMLAMVFVAGFVVGLVSGVLRGADHFEQSRQSLEETLEYEP